MSLFGLLEDLSLLWLAIQEEGTKILFLSQCYTSAGVATFASTGTPFKMSMCFNSCAKSSVVRGNSCHISKTNFSIWDIEGCNIFDWLISWPGPVPVREPAVENNWLYKQCFSRNTMRLGSRLDASSLQLCLVPCNGLLCLSLPCKFTLHPAPLAVYPNPLANTEFLTKSSTYVNLIAKLNSSKCNNFINWHCQWYFIDHSCLSLIT